MATKVSYAVSNILDPGTSTSEIVINESGAAVDFRVESSIDPNAIFINGTTGEVSVNGLDDYEEGTFQLTLTDSVGNSTAATFRYLKIGRCVNIQGVSGGPTYISLANLNGAGQGTNVSFSGTLPFTPTGFSFDANGIMPVLGWRDGSTTVYLDHNRDEKVYDFSNTCARDSNRTNIVVQIQGWYYTNS